MFCKFIQTFVLKWRIYVKLELIPNNLIPNINQWKSSNA